MGNLFAEIDLHALDLEVSLAIRSHHRTAVITIWPLFPLAILYRLVLSVEARVNLFHRLGAFVASSSMPSHCRHGAHTPIQ